MVSSDAIAFFGCWVPVPCSVGMVAVAWLKTWWWPAFAFIYPFLFWPGDNTPSHSHGLLVGLTVLFVFGALVLDGPRLVGVIRGKVESRRLGLIGGQRWVVLTALAFAGWVVVSSALSPVPRVAFLGSVGQSTDGGLWQVLYIGMFLLVFLRIPDAPGMERRVALSVVAAGSVMAVLALVEVLTRRPLIAHVPVGALPVLMFPQKGHLAGMLTLVLGIAAGLWSNYIVAILSVGLGLTGNRAGTLGALGALLAMLTSLDRRLVVLSSALVVGLAVGWGIPRFAEYTRHGGAPMKYENPVEAASLRTRFYMWEDAVHGISARPLLGWGGGVYQQVWPRFLSRGALAGFVRSEWGYKVEKLLPPDGAYPQLLARTTSNQRVRLVITSWKAHNQLLEAALMWGIPGLIGFCLLCLFGLSGLARLEPLSLGVLAYIVFLQFWFVIPQVQGLFWCVLGVASARGLEGRARSVG